MDSIRMSVGGVALTVGDVPERAEAAPRRVDPRQTSHSRRRIRS
jgi:hypothetical protein